MNGICKPELLKVECNYLLRLVRAKRDDVIEGKILLEERARTLAPEIATQDAILALENELFLADMCLTRLWKAYTECTSVADKTQPDTS